LSGIDSVLATGASIIAQTTLTHKNKNDLGNIAKLLFPKKIKVWRLQFSLPCGRGQEFALKEEFSLQETTRLMEDVYVLSKEYPSMHVDMHAIQYYKVFLYKKYGNDIKKKMLMHLRGGCSLMKGGIIYVDSDGFLRPCPHFPYRIEDESVRTKSISDIFRSNALLKNLRNKSLLHGACRECKYLFCCGGCRAKVFYKTKDFFAEDNDCPFLELKNKQVIN